jgi:hypothetical protein
MPCPGSREVTSTVTEHETLAARDHVSTHAAGRIEGSREHTNLAIARARDTCATATTSASSPGEPPARRLPFEIHAGGRDYVRTLAVHTLAEDDLTACPARRD